MYWDMERGPVSPRHWHAEHTTAIHTEVKAAWGPSPLPPPLTHWGRNHRDQEVEKDQAELFRGID